MLILFARRRPPTHIGTYGRHRWSSQAAHVAGCAPPVVRVQCSWREQKGGLSAVLDASTADALDIGEDGEPAGLGGVSPTVSTTGYLPGEGSRVLQVLARGAVSIDEEEKLPFAVEAADDVGTLFRYCLL